MAEFLGVVVSVVLLLIVLLPVLSFLRLGRISRELEELTGRVARLERRDAAAAPVPEPVAWPAAVPVDQSPRFDEPAPPEAAPDAREAPDLEERIGGRGLLYTGVLVLLIGVSFFLKYAFENAWVGETGRSVLGAFGGIGLVIGGSRLATRGMAAFGQALIGTGFAILYLVVYAALTFYTLIDPASAFALMAAITIAGAYVADRMRSQALAFIAVGGAFLTPPLIGLDIAQLTLFTYVAVLVVGTLFLSLRHQWLALNALSYIATVVTVVAWASQYYSEQEWLRTFLFLTLFCVCFINILRATRYSEGLIARGVRALLFTAPIVYHATAVVMTAGHPPAIHVYLIAFTVVGLWLTVDPYRPFFRLAMLLGVLVPLFGELTLPDGASWLVPNVVTITAVAVLHIMALVDRVGRQEETLRGPDLLALHLTGLGLFALLYGALQPAFPGFRGGLAALLAMAAAALARWFNARDEIAALNSLGLAFALAAIGIAVQFDGPVVVIGWAAEGAAAAWLGVRMSRYPFQLGGLLLWALAVIRLFESLPETPAVFTPLFNARTLATFFVVVVGYVMAAKLAAIERADSVRMRAAVHVLASVLTLGWITAEIRSFWEVRYDSPQAYLYEQMLLSLAWGIYGAIVIAVGMARGFAPLRYIGIVVIALTSLKVFFYDLWELGGIYRVIGFIGFGVLLMLVSYLYQKRRATDRVAQPERAPDVEPPESIEAGDGTH